METSLSIAARGGSPLAQETSRYEKPTALGLDVREPSYVAFARHWPTAGGVNGMLAAPSLT